MFAVTENLQRITDLSVSTRSSHTVARRSKTNYKKKMKIIVDSGLQPPEGVDNLFIKLGIISIRLVYFALSLLS